ncbi:MAG: NAD(P)-dependent oxidoreductase [Proteobacteria bacterium]|nr:NAD(P)-dependent oxidoreductase [Pseudomonadota bacterium]
MQRFVGETQAWPEKRPAGERARDFLEIHREFIAEKASIQAARCAQCGVPFCQFHCPLQNNIPDWLKLTADGRLEEAYRAAAATNPMPEICGRICPQDRLCEVACVLEQSKHGAVTIGAVERYLTEAAWSEGWVDAISPRLERAESIGIVGAGPAGLAAAERLRQRGYRVTIYDRHDRAGGLLIYGIPNFKLEKHLVMRRVERLRAGGVSFELNCNVGETISLNEVRSRHDALLIATGVYKAKPLNAPTHRSVVPALEFLIAANRIGLGDEVADFANGRLNAKDRRVVVIGGGDTAMDCVRTAQRQGAESVICLYRRDRTNMPGSQREVVHAEEEGVTFDWLAAPKSVRGGKSPAVKAVRMRLGAPDASGRQTPEEVQDSAYELSSDLVITALGFDPENLSAWGLETTREGTLAVNRRFETSLSGVFAAGDIVRGASLVVWAIKEGRDAADAVHDWMRTQARMAAQ